MPSYDPFKYPTSDQGLCWRLSLLEFVDYWFQTVRSGRRPASADSTIAFAMIRCRFASTPGHWSDPRFLSNRWGPPQRAASAVIIDESTHRRALGSCPASFGSARNGQTTLRCATPEEINRYRCAQRHSVILTYWYRRASSLNVSPSAK